MISKRPAWISGARSFCAISSTGGAAATSSITSCAGVNRSRKECRARKRSGMCAAFCLPTSSATTPTAIGKHISGAATARVTERFASNGSVANRVSPTARRSACTGHCAPIPHCTRGSMPQSRPRAPKMSLGADCCSACTTSRPSCATSHGVNPNETPPCVSWTNSTRAAASRPLHFQRSPLKSAAKISMPSHRFCRRRFSFAAC